MSDYEEKDIETKMKSMDLDDSTFYCRLNQGYTFRALIAFLKATNSEANFVFNKKNITYEKDGLEGSIINKLVIDGSKIEYEYSGKEESIFCGSNLNTLNLLTKSTGKKEGIVIRKEKDSGALKINIVEDDKSPEGMNDGNFDLKKVPIEKYDLPDEDKDPSFNVSVNSFARICANVASFKNPYITIKMSKNGIFFTSMAPKNESPSVCGKEGKTPNFDEKNVLYTLDVKYSIIKALSRLSNISSGGIGFYCNKNGDGFLRLNVSVGDYGSLKIYLFPKQK